MDIGIKHILLLVAIFVFIGVFYRMISSRLYNVIKEGVTDRSCDNPYSDSDTLPLREYIIKACYNSAYDPSESPKVSVANLEKRIAEGYRFIDLNVFSSDQKLYVGYSADNNPTLTDVSIPFTEALDCIKKHAFTKSTKKLPEDKMPLLEPKPTVETSASIRDTYVEYPMFVFIRVYRSPGSKFDIVKELAGQLGETADTKFLRDGKDATQIDGCTPIAKIKGRILFVMDIVNIVQIYAPEDKPSADQIPVETRNFLKQFVNIYAGGNIWRHGSPDKSLPLLISDPKDPYRSNLFNMQILIPSLKTTSNPDALSIILNTSIQTVVVRPYLDDTHLASYTKMFSDLKRPMVCGVHAYAYIKGKQ